MTYTEATNGVFRELERAKSMHPHWPDDVIHAVAIVAEESGEAIRAAVQYVYEGGSLEAVKTELTQTAAAAIRALEGL